MNIPYIGGAYIDRYGKINHQECQNLFPTVDSESGKVNAIIGTPGLELWAAPGTGEVRGMHVFGSYLYAVIGQTLYRIDTSGAATAMTGTIPYGTNALTNGGFETLGTGVHPDIFGTWNEVVVGTGTISAETGYAGTYSCRLDSGGASGNADIGQQGITLEANQTYRLSFVYKQSYPSEYAYMYIYLYDPYDYYSFSNNAFGNPTYQELRLSGRTSWTEFSIIINSHKTKTSDYVIGFGIYPTISGANQYFEFDQVVLEPYRSCHKVWFQDNGSELMMVGGDKAYYLLGTTVTEVTNLTTLGSPATLAYQDGYFISSMASSGQFFISGSYDVTAWDALDYSTAEGDPDYLQVVISENRELWLLGKTSYEVWYNSGDSEFPFDRISGAVRKIGCIAPNSACGFMGTVVWLDDRRYVRASNGYNAEKISTSQVDYHIASYSKVTDAVGYTYSQEGHTFYVLTFPTEDKTWVYDFSTKYWHTRASGESDNRHPANCYAKFDDKHLVGDYSNGRIYYYDLGKYTDNGAPLHRVRSARAIRDDRKRVYHSRFELDFDLG